MIKKIKDKKINIAGQVWTVNTERYSYGHTITFYREDQKESRFSINLATDEQQALLPLFDIDALLEHIILVYGWGFYQGMNNSRILNKIVSTLQEGGII